MICKIHGTLESLIATVARVDTGNGLTYEVMLPAFAAARLGGHVGRPVTLQTFHYLEGSSQGANFIPRLAGFLSETDREFFTAFTSVKGIGAKKALRAMTMSTTQIAAAIADRDVKTLQSLPEIGRRMAETVIATLHGKLDRFVSDAAYGERRADGTVEGEAGSHAPGATPLARSAAREALEVLLQLGENRAAAVQWIDQALIKQPDIDSPSELVTQVLRLKAGV